MQPAAQDVIFEPADEVLEVQAEAQVQAQEQGAEEENQQQSQATLVLDNLPWIVKTHFDFQDMI